MAELNLQWWQALLALLGTFLTVTGFSAAPWVRALLTGRLVPATTVEKLMAAKDAVIAGLTAELARERTRGDDSIARIVIERDHEREAVKVERDRSDASAKAVMQLSQEYGETMLHLARGAAELEAGS